MQVEMLNQARQIFCVGLCFKTCSCRIEGDCENGCGLSEQLLPDQEPRAMRMGHHGLVSWMSYWGIVVHQCEGQGCKHCCSPLSLLLIVSWLYWMEEWMANHLFLECRIEHTHAHTHVVAFLQKKVLELMTSCNRNQARFMDYEATVPHNASRASIDENDDRNHRIVCFCRKPWIRRF